MSGIVVPVMEYQVFNHSFLVSPNTEDVIVADRIPVSRFAFIGGSFRIHDRNLSAGAQYQIIIRGLNPSPRDGADFVFATDIASTAAITPSAPAIVPALVALTSPITNLQHPMIRVVVKATGPSAAGIVYIILSGDLTMRESG